MSPGLTTFRQSWILVKSPGILYVALVARPEADVDDVGRAGFEDGGANWLLHVDISNDPNKVIIKKRIISQYL